VGTLHTKAAPADDGVNILSKPGLEIHPTRYDEILPERRLNPCERKKSEVAPGNQKRLEVTARNEWGCTRKSKQLEATEVLLK